jgi:hypothetical protein
MPFELQLESRHEVSDADFVVSLFDEGNVPPSPSHSNAVPDTDFTAVIVDLPVA